MKKYIDMKRGVIIILMLVMASCSEEFLEKKPVDQSTDENFYTSYEELRGSSAALYSHVWFDFNRDHFSLGDSRAGNLLSPWGSYAYYRFTLSALDPGLLNSWAAFYAVIAQANVLEKNVNQYARNVSEQQKLSVIAEARFMRAMAYFLLVRLWGPVILIEDNGELLEDVQRAPSSIEDVYQFVFNDLKFAVKYLPIEDSPGRLTKWSAKGLLGKAYLAFSGYQGTGGQRDQALLDSAKHYAGDVCQNSGIELMDNYGDLYKYANNNNEEGLFAIQWTKLGEWGYQNANLSDLAFSSEIVGGAQAWSSTTASYDYLANIELADTFRRNATFMTAGTHYPEINQDEGGYTYTDTTNAHIKKYVPGGPNDGNDGNVESLNSPLNTYMLRLADVYLVYAEACLGNNDSLRQGDEGWVYFDAVRQRANVPSKTAVGFEDFMYERRMELTMEGKYWMDLVTWYYFKPDFILNYINSQERGATYTYHKTDTGRLVLTKSDPPNAPLTATAEDMYYPYPEAEVLANPKLKGEPQPYDFDEQE